MLMTFITAKAQTTTNEPYDWTNIMEAIIKVESEGKPNAHNQNGNCVGILQITRICLKEANEILKSKGSSKRFSNKDRLDPTKSKEIFVLIQNKYNPQGDIVKACRIWNEGPYYNKKIKTTSYVKKVLKKYNGGN